MRKWIMPVIAGIGTIVGLTGGIIGICSAAAPSPVHICQNYTNCANGQFLEVFDKNGSPIFSVGETGGAKTFGDCTSEYNTTDIFNAAVTLCYKPPAGACKAPSTWLSPQGLYSCVTGTWKKKI